MESCIRFANGLQQLYIPVAGHDQDIVDELQDLAPVSVSRGINTRFILIVSIAERRRLDVSLIDGESKVAKTEAEGLRQLTNQQLTSSLGACFKMLRICIFSSVDDIPLRIFINTYLSMSLLLIRRPPRAWNAGRRCSSSWCMYSGG
jgi:hypothetical protein